jgi:uracil phosphoribosyltransferase
MVDHAHYLSGMTPTDYSKLPPSPPIDQVFLLDPLIATGGTACAALGMIVDWGISGMFPLFRKLAPTGLCPYLTVKNVKLLCILASDVGLKHVQTAYPDLEVGLELEYAILPG